MSLTRPTPYDFALTAAAPKLGGSYPGTFIRCVAADEPFTLSLDGIEVPFRGGNWVRIPPGSDDHFIQVHVLRAQGALLPTNNIRLIVAGFEFGDDALTFTGAINVAPGTSVKIAAPTTLATLADVVLVANTNTQLFAANANATRRTVRNTGTADVRIATAAADLTAGRGKIVGPGEEWESGVSGVLYARSAGTPTLVLSEETY